MPVTANSTAAQNYLGLAISWGLGQVTIVVNGVTTPLGQSADTEMKVDEAMNRDQRGNVAQYTGYNPNDSTTFEYVFAISGTYDSGTASVTYPTAGTMITIGADATDPISGSNWIVGSVGLRAANTDAKKVSLKCTRYLGIQQ